MTTLTKVERPEVKVTKNGSGVKVTVSGSYPRTDKKETTQALVGGYQAEIAPTGSVAISYEYKPVNAKGPLSEAGMSLVMPAKFSEFRWIGDGPHAAYPGKDRLNEFGLFHLNRKDLRFQGNRRGTELALLTTPEGAGTALATIPGDLAVEIDGDKTLLKHNAAISGLGNKIGAAETMIDSAKIDRIAGSFTLVPLVRHHSYTWTTAQTFTAEAEVAHYGPATLKSIGPRWTLTDAEGKELATGVLPTTDIPQGTLTQLGSISIDLRKIPAPQNLTLSLALPGTGFSNHYPLWVYPEDLQPATPAGVYVARAFDERTRAELAQGGKVLLIPESPPARSVEGAFITDFWCYPMFKRYNPPGTMGLLCDPAHPALTGFPTEFHSNWQWWRLARNSRPVNLNHLPCELRPIVQVIDNADRNHRLGLVWEARVGTGKLLVCSSDLIGQQQFPEVRQFTHSLFDYAASPAFAPTAQVGVDALAELFAPATKK